MDKILFEVSIVQKYVVDGKTSTAGTIIILEVQAKSAQEAFDKGVAYINVKKLTKCSVNSVYTGYPKRVTL